jgi:hypothetical protein
LTGKAGGDEKLSTDAVSDLKQAGSFSKTDLMYEISYNSKFVPERSPRVSVKTTTRDGNVNHLMHNQDTGEYYDLDEPSKLVWDLVDGERTVQQITRDIKSSGRVDDPDEVSETLLFFAESGALTSKEDPVREKRVQITSPFETRVILIKDARSFLGAAHRILKPILRPSMFWTSMALVVVGALLFAPRFESIFGNPGNFRIAGSVVVGFLFYQFILLAPVTALHELAHGIALVHYGGRAKDIGTGMFYFGPMFYVNATDSWSLSRRQRIMILWAGNLATVLVGAIIVVVGVLVPYPDWIANTLYVAAFFCFYGTLWQLAPPFETDGYYMLTDILNMPDLRSESFEYFKSVVSRVFGTSSPKRESLTPKKRAILLGYAVFSVSFVVYLAVLSVRFTSYMAGDAVSWAERLLASASVGSVLSLTAYLVGIVSIGYFALTVSGYGVLIGSQIKRSLAGTMRFETVHSRHATAFFYIPAGTPSASAERFERRVQATASKLTSSFSVGRDGPLMYASLRMGETRVPLQELRTNLRRIEDNFYRAHQDFARSTIKHLVSTGTNASLTSLLVDMANKTTSGSRSEARTALREYLETRERNARYFLNSTFSTAWTIEIPPSEQSDLLESLLPSLLVSDLTMTNLAENTEEFKKQVIYGSESISELAEKSFKEQEKALARPHEFQLVSTFEPVRGRIMFIGRTKRVEKHLKELVSLFPIHVWAGYFDNLMGDVNLILSTVVHSLTSIPKDLTVLSDGEVSYLEGCLSTLEGFQDDIVNNLLSYPSTAEMCATMLERLKTIFEPERKARIGLFDAAIALNHGSLSSLPLRAREASKLSEAIIKWAGAVKESLRNEMENRDVAYHVKRRRFLRAYGVVAAISILPLALSLALPESSLILPLQGAFVGLQAACLLAYLRILRSTRRMTRHPSVNFSQVLAPIYATAQAFFKLILASEVMNPSDALAWVEKFGVA